MTLSVILPCLGGAADLPACLRALGAVDGAPIGEIIVADGGSSDDSAGVARRAGARVIELGEPGRGRQLRLGAAAAEGEWLLFLHVDTVLDPSWRAAARQFMADAENHRRVGAFTLAFDDDTPGARRVARLANWRSRWLALPYGDQGLLISRDLYRDVGGYRDLGLMEDVDFIRRLRRLARQEGVHRPVRLLPARAVTSARRYRRDGYFRRPLRNLSLLALYFAGVPPCRLERLYR